ncbi:hypothetical protein KR51_00026130, partial [Rubidibacter lacunae KORDI 51-2]
SQGRYEEALPMYQKAVEILFQKLGSSHPNSQAGFDNYVYCLFSFLNTLPIEEALQRLPQEAHEDYLTHRSTQESSEND